MLETFLDDIREHFDIDFSAYKTPTIMRRLQRRIVATNSGALSGYKAFLDAHPEEYQQLVNAFLIKVTDFFRDPDLFAYLRQQVVPDMLDYARKHGNELRVWSAGCATGEEAYSLAMLIAEALGSTLDLFTVRIFATDLDADAITFARRGIYTEGALASLPPNFVANYFIKDGTTYQVNKRIRALTIFGQHDLGQRAPFPHVDMVVCRNVLIYFSPELQQRTLQLFAYSLRDGGYLVLGKAETPGPLAEIFHLQDKQQKVYRRHGERFLVPLGFAPAPSQRPTAPSQRSLRQSRRLEESERQRFQSTQEHIFSQAPVGIVIVDRRYDIQLINATARRYFGIHGPAIGDDLIHAVHNGQASRLREAIDAVFQGARPIDVENILVEDVTTGAPRYLHIICQPQPSDGEATAPTSVMVVAHDVTAYVVARRELEYQLSARTGELQSVQQEVGQEAAAREQLLKRLVETNKHLLEANQELTSANEELRSTNHEFLLGTEEAQAATEEVETLNEELQATNEELETLNEELQATIEELNTTNDDLNERGLELQGMSRGSEQARDRLEAILSSMGDAVLVVDSTGAPVLTNTTYDQLFSSGATLLDAQGQPLAPEHTPLGRAARGEHFIMEFTLNGADGSQRWFEANGQPITDSKATLTGGVVTIRDITDRGLRLMQEEFMGRVSHELRTPLTSLQAYLQLLLKHLKEPVEAPRVQAYAEKALTQNRRMARLVTDIMEAVRLQNGKYSLELEPVRLADALEQSVEIAQPLTTGQHVRLHVADASLVAQADPGRVQQVLLNLLTNAIQHAPNTEFIDVRLRREGAYAAIEVQDYGRGIAPAERQTIFTRFVQMDKQNSHGLGLGLYIAKELVTAQQGTLDVVSELGKGATFIIRLPLLTEAPKKAKGAK